MPPAACARHAPEGTATECSAWARAICSREPNASACAYANIYEQCDNFVPDPGRADVLASQLDDTRGLATGAQQRGAGTTQQPGTTASKHPSNGASPRCTEAHPRDLTPRARY